MNIETQRTYRAVASYTLDGLKKAVKDLSEIPEDAVGYDLVIQRLPELEKAILIIESDLDSGEL